MKNKRILIAVGNCILLLFLGLVYAWSVFKKPLAAEFGWSDGMLTWNFTICMSFFCIGSFIAAKITRKIKHQFVVLAAGVMIFAGFFLASRMTSVWQLYVCYGVMIGFSVGAVYNCVLSVGNRWFADRAGMMTGIFLMCFGSGSLIFGPLSTSLMGSLGWRETFVILGILFILVFTLTSFWVYMPGDNVQIKPKTKVAGITVDVSTQDMFKTRNFWFYFVWSTLLSAVGLGIVGQVFTISNTFKMSDMVCSYMVSLVAVCNGIGRFCFGSIYDIKGRKLTMTVVSLVALVGVGLLAIAIQSGTAAILVAAFIFMGFGYGGITPSNSNFIRDYFGLKHYPTNFSIINFNLLISVFVGQWAGSSLYMKTGGYMATAIAMLVLCVLGFLSSLNIRAARKD
jgi:OFA family oxalate/formate antiporter-like MFS transporter